MRLVFILLPVNLFLLITFNYNYAQTGPGGVGNSITNPLWLDAHTMGGSNGASIFSWTDYSGNANHATENINVPNFATGVMNGRDAINFDGNELLFSPANTGLNNATYFNYFMAAEIDNVNQLSCPFIFDYGSHIYDRIFSGYISQNGTWSNFSRTTSGSLMRPFYSSNSGLQIYEGVYDDANNLVNGELSFVDEGTVGGNCRATGTHNGFWVGGYNNGTTITYKADIKIGEIFVFASPLNSAQQNIVENYLGAKFGIVPTTDLYSFEGTYGLGVIGIGRDDVANLHTDSQGNGYVRINNPSDLQDGEYLFIGHDDVELTSFNINTNVPASLPGSSRFVRQWRAEKTGDLGNITLIFDLDPSTDFSPDPNNYRLLIDGDVDMSGTIDHIHSGTYNAGDNSITFTNIDLQTNDFFTLGGDTPPDIHSITDGSWNTPGTWDCTCIPSSFNNVFIDPGDEVTVDVEAFANSLTVENTGTLIMDQEFTLNLFGDFNINGALNLTAGEVKMTGASNQGIDGAGGTHTFHDLTIDNSTGSTITLHPASYTLEGLLSMQNGVLDVDNTSNGQLIIESTSATTGGRIGPIMPGTSITGEVTARRHIPAGSADYRNLASPVIGATFVDWDPDLAISCADCPDGQACGPPDGCFNSIKRYQINQYIPITSINTNIENGTGYEVWVGNDLVNWSGGTLNQTGTVNGSSDKVISVGSQWHTKGNPFVCPYDFDDVSFAGVGRYFYIYDEAIGDYQWYDWTSKTSSTAELADGYVAIGQGMWMKGPGTFTIPQTAKVTTDDVTFIRTSKPEDHSLYFKLSENASTYASIANIEQNINFTDGYDEYVDIDHLETPNQKGPSFAFIVEENLVRKTFLDKSLKDKILPVHVKILNEGYYTIAADNIENYSDYAFVYLLDKQTGEQVNLKDENYVFHAFEGTDDERFVMILSNQEVAADSPLAGQLEIDLEDDVQIIQMGNILNIDADENLENVAITLYNTLGQAVHVFSTTNLNEGSNVLNVPVGTSGVRILSINYNGKLITKKLVF